MPSEFDTHPARMVIVSLLELEPDHTHQLWRRRAIYTEENFNEWQECSSLSLRRVTGRAHAALPRAGTHPSGSGPDEFKGIQIEKRTR